MGRPTARNVVGGREPALLSIFDIGEGLMLLVMPAESGCHSFCITILAREWLHRSIGRNQWHHAHTAPALKTRRRVCNDALYTKA